MSSTIISQEPLTSSPIPSKEPILLNSPSAENVSWDTPSVNTGDTYVDDVDESLQKRGAEQFGRFVKCHTQLGDQWLGFTNAIRPLGSSAVLISCCSRLRASQQSVLRCFHTNATEMYPDHVGKDFLLAHGGPTLKQTSFRSRSEDQSRTRQVRPPNPFPVDDIIELPGHLKRWAQDLNAFLRFMHDVPEFKNFAVEQLQEAILALEGDLRYQASSLEDFEGQFKSNAVQKYVNDLTMELSEDLEAVRDALKLFIQDGVGIIKAAQEHTQAEFQSLATVATLFSGVTATTLQLSYSNHNNFLQEFVNALWFSSLVFSVASAINSQLAYFWKSAVYRSPMHTIPWWVALWLTRTPLAFLVVSVLAFSGGLVCFAFASGQGTLVTTCATAFTVLTSFSLFFGASWIVGERAVFRNSEGNRWLPEVLGQVGQKVLEAPPRTVKRAATWSSQKISRAGSSLSNLSSPAGTTINLTNPEEWPTKETTGPTEQDGGLTSSPSSFNSALPPPPRRNEPRTVSEPRGDVSHQRQHRQRWPRRRVRDLASLVPALRAMVPSETLTEHQGLIQHMQFAPNGKWLATCSKDKMVIIWKVGEPFEMHRMLLHPGSGSVSQVLWSPDGKYLLTRMNRAVKIWSPETGVLQTTVRREHQISAVAWLPGGDSYGVVERDHVFVYDVRGIKQDFYHLERTHPNSMAYTPDGRWLLLVGDMLHSKDGLIPMKSKAEKRIIVFGLEERRVVFQVPVLADVREVSVSADGSMALISYDGETPPETWSIDVTGRECGLSMRNTYRASTPTSFSGPACFGGPNDEFVMVLGKRNEILIWETDSGIVLHGSHGGDTDGNQMEGLTSIAWNSHQTQPMMASGGTEGTVTVWKSPPPSED